MLSVENFTLGPSAEQDFDVNFTAATLLQGVYSTRICAYNQTETGAFLYFMYHTRDAIAKHLSSQVFSQVYYGTTPKLSSTGWPVNQEAPCLNSCLSNQRTKDLVHFSCLAQTGQVTGKVTGQVTGLVTGLVTGQVTGLVLCRH